MVVALVGGQPVPLFTGAVPEQQVREVFAQLLQLAAQNGVTGSSQVDGARPQPADEAEAAEPALPPLHAEAFDAIEAGDYARAIAPTRRPSRRTPATRTPAPGSDRCGCWRACRRSTCRRLAPPPRRM